MLTTILGSLRRVRASVRRQRAQANVIPFPVTAARDAEAAEPQQPVAARRELTILSYDNAR
jgi:hypothetical protein